MRVQVASLPADLIQRHGGNTMRCIRVTMRRLTVTSAVMVLVLAGINNISRSNNFSISSVASTHPLSSTPKPTDVKSLPPNTSIRADAKQSIAASSARQLHFSHDCDQPAECYANLKRIMEKHMALSDYHDAMHLKHANPITDEVGQETVLMPTPRSTWHLNLAVKYYRAAAHPWLPVAPDPPEPISSTAAESGTATRAPRRIVRPPASF